MLYICRSDESKGDEAIEQDIKKLDEEAKAAERTSGVGVDKEKSEAKERLEAPTKPSILDLSAKDPLRRASRSSETSNEKPKPRKVRYLQELENWMKSVFFAIFSSF